MGSLQLGSFVRVLSLATCSLAVLPASAQTIDSQLADKKFMPGIDISLGVFGQLTSARVPEKTFVLPSGTSTAQTTQGTSPSAGVLGAFHQSLRPWLGYKVNLGYSRFSEKYSQGSSYIPPSGGQFPPSDPPNSPYYSFAQGSIGTNMYELTVAYAVQGPKTKRFSTSAQLGGGGLFFLPTQDPSPYAEQVRAAMVFGVGMDYKLSEHYALRAEYRGLFYTNPDFKNSNTPIPISKLFTVTNEPTLSIVYSFGHKKKTSGKMY